MPNLPVGSSGIALHNFVPITIGSQSTINVPARLRWLVRSIRYTLATDANVADRRLCVDITSYAAQMYRLNASIVQTANATIDYFFMPGAPVQTSFIGDTLVQPLPSPMLLRAPASLISDVQNLQATDQITGPYILLERWLEL